MFEGWASSASESTPTCKGQKRLVLRSEGQQPARTDRRRKRNKPIRNEQIKQLKTQDREIFTVGYFRKKPSASGAGNSDPTMPDVLRRNRAASEILGIWTNYSSESTASSTIYGVRWIRTVMSSIFFCSLAVISLQPSGSFADCYAAKASNHSGSSPTS